MENQKKGLYLNQESAEDYRREQLERREERAEMLRRAKFHRWMWALALVAGAGGLIYMILNGLIDMNIGVVLLAAVSAVCGRGTGCV